MSDFKSDNNYNDDGGGFIPIIMIFLLCIFSFGGLYKAYMIYNFADYEESIVLKKRKKVFHGFRSHTVDYYLTIDSFGEEKEFDSYYYSNVEENQRISFFVYKNDPDYFILTDTKEKNLYQILNKSLRWYHKLFFCVFILIAGFFIISSYIIMFAELFKFNSSGSDSRSYVDGIISVIIHTLIFLFGVGFAYYMGRIILNYVVSNENLAIWLVGIFMLMLLALVLVIPFFIQKIYEIYQSDKVILLRRIKNSILIFTLGNLLIAFFGILAKNEEFSIIGMWDLIKNFWSAFL